MQRYSIDRLKDLAGGWTKKRTKTEYSIDIVLQYKEYSKLVEMARNDKQSLTAFVTDIIKDRLYSTKIDYKDREWKLLA